MSTPTPPAGRDEADLIAAYSRLADDPQMDTISISTDKMRRLLALAERAVAAEALCDMSADERFACAKSDAEWHYARNTVLEADLADANARLANDGSLILRLSDTIAEQDARIAELTPLADRTVVAEVRQAELDSALAAAEKRIAELTTALNTAERELSVKSLTNIRLRDELREEIEARSHHETKAALVPELVETASKLCDGVDRLKAQDDELWEGYLSQEVYATRAALAKAKAVLG